MGGRHHARVRLNELQRTLISKSEIRVFEIQDHCTIGNAKLFPLPEDLTQPQRLRRRLGELECGAIPDKAGGAGRGRQEALSPMRKEEKAAAHSVPGNGLGSGYPSL